MVDGASITATVETIDHDKRTIALKGPRGNVVALKVGPDEKNFQQIKTGDRVTAKYYESSSSCASPMSFLLRSEGPLAERGSTVEVAAPGQHLVLSRSMLLR